jgi:hypothetical protein
VHGHDPTEVIVRVDRRDVLECEPCLRARRSGDEVRSGDIYPRPDNGKVAWVANLERVNAGSPSVSA